MLSATRSGLDTARFEQSIFCKLNRKILPSARAVATEYMSRHPGADFSYAKVKFQVQPESSIDNIWDFFEYDNAYEPDDKCHAHSVANDDDCSPPETTPPDGNN